MSKFMTIRPVGAEMFHAEWRTEGHDGVNSDFSQFCVGAYKKPLPFYLWSIIK
jgi:hypothetical protein